MKRFFKQNKLLISGVVLLLITIISLKVSNDNYYRSVFNSSFNSNKGLKNNFNYNSVLEKELQLKKKELEKKLAGELRTKDKTKKVKNTKEKVFSKTYPKAIKKKYSTKKQVKTKTKKQVKLLTGLYRQYSLAKLALDSYHAKGGKKGRLIVIKKYGKTLYQVSY